MNQEDLSFLKIAKDSFTEEINCKLEFLRYIHSDNLRLKIESNKIDFERVKRALNEILKRKIVEEFQTKKCVVDLFSTDRNKRILLDNIEKKNQMFDKK